MVETGLWCEKSKIPGSQGEDVRIHCQLHDPYNLSGDPKTVKQLSHPFLMIMYEVCPWNLG